MVVVVAVVVVVVQGSIARRPWVQQVILKPPAECGLNIQQQFLTAYDLFLDFPRKTAHGKSHGSAKLDVKRYIFP